MPGLRRITSNWRGDPSRSLQSRFLGLPYHAIQLLKRCVINDPRDRDTCEELMEHAYFDGFRETIGAELEACLERDFGSGFHMRPRSQRASSFESASNSACGMIASVPWIGSTYIVLSRLVSRSVAPGSPSSSGQSSSPYTTH